MSSYRWLILKEILRALTDDTTFSPEPGDSCQMIPRENIIFRKVSVKVTPVNAKWTMTPAFPGIIVSTPYSEPFNNEDGEVGHDAYRYHFLVQIIDSDQHEPEANIQSYWKWQEQVQTLFQSKCNWPGLPPPHVLSNAVSVDVVDETKWVVDANFVAGVHIVVEAWMERGVEQANAEI